MGHGPFEEVIPGVIRGEPEWHLSASYWARLAHDWDGNSVLFRQPDCLVEEVIFCLLGGFGIKAEANIAAFRLLKRVGVTNLKNDWAEADIRALLKRRLRVNGGYQRYRFPNQRARRIVLALRRLREGRTPTDPISLREYLIDFDGIGPKTASWIVRNWLCSDDVAILDIHVIRACQRIGVFYPHHRVPRDYNEMEERFIEFASAISVRPSKLDALMWSTMRKLPLVHTR